MNHGSCTGPAVRYIVTVPMSPQYLRVVVSVVVLTGTSGAVYV